MKNPGYTTTATASPFYTAGRRARKDYPNLSADAALSTWLGKKHPIDRRKRQDVLEKTGGKSGAAYKAWVDGFNGYNDITRHEVANPQPKTKLDLMLDQVASGSREITFDVREWTPENVNRLEATARGRGLDVSGDGQYVLVRPPVRSNPIDDYRGNDYRIAFTTDKWGNKIAYREDVQQGRNFRIGLEVAELLIATGRAKVVPYHSFTAASYQADYDKAEAAKKQLEGWVPQGKANPEDTAATWDAMGVKERFDLLTTNGVDRKDAMLSAMSAFSEMRPVEQQRIKKLLSTPTVDPYAKGRQRAQIAIDAAIRRWQEYLRELTPKEKKAKAYMLREYEAVLDTVKDITQEDRQDVEEAVKGLIMRYDPTTGGVLGHKSNPEPDAADLYEEFHGRPSTEIIEVESLEHHHDYLAVLGELVEITIELLEGDHAGKLYQLTFDGCGMFLAASEDRTTLYIKGGDQSLPLDSMGLGHPTLLKDSMVIGYMRQITYQTQKAFDDFATIDYYHKAGEETGQLPILLYAPSKSGSTPALSLSGGAYEIKDVGITN